MTDLKSIHPRFEAAFNAGDVEALVALYEPDAVMALSPGKLARGIAEIRAVFEQFAETHAKMRLETATTLETGDGLALLHGKWTLTGRGPDGHPFEAAATSAEVLRRQPDGRWLYVLDNPFGA